MTSIPSDRAGRTIVVTGGGSGVGRAVALEFARGGWCVALFGRRRTALEETAADCGPDVLPCALDVTDQTAVRAAFDAVIVRFGRVDAVFNAAGMFGTPEPFETLSLEAWRAVLDTNVTGSFVVAQEAFRRFVAQQPAGGRIINCGSLSAHVPRPLATAYTVSKHAITGLTRSIALEGRRWNVACGQLDIGNAATEMTAGFNSGTLQADMTRRAEPMMQASDVGRAAFYMASLPLDANVLTMTVMASHMPFVGRG